MEQICISPVCILGFLLLNVAFHIVGLDGGVRKVRYHGHRRHHGGNDVGVATSHGSHGPSHSTPLRPRWNVYLLNFHHDLFSHKGVSY